MASDFEKLLDTFEAALTALLLASFDEPSDSIVQLRSRLATARGAVETAMTSKTGAANDYRTAVDRAFGTARQQFR